MPDSLPQRRMVRHAQSFGALRGAKYPGILGIAVTVVATMGMLPGHALADETPPAPPLGAETLAPPDNGSGGSNGSGSQDGSGTPSAEARPYFATAAPAASAAAHPDDAPAVTFRKGELTTIGPLMIVPPYNRAGAAVGWRQIGYTQYLFLTPLLDMSFDEGRYRFGVWVPLNMEIIDLRIDPESASGDKVGTKHLGRIRTADWDDPRDYVRILRYFTIGRKEDNLYLNLSQFQANTLGHGFLMRNYIPNVDLNAAKLSMAFDAYGDWGGFQLYTDDVTAAHIAGGLVFLKPLAFLEDVRWRSLSIGVSYMAHRDAPVRLDLFRNNADARFRVERRAAIHAFDADVELKVYKQRDPDSGIESDVKVYIDGAAMIPDTTSSYTWRIEPDPARANVPAPTRAPTRFEGGWGGTVGVLGRFDIQTGLRQAIRARMEYRVFNENHMPGYFDALYEYQQYKFISERFALGRSPYAERAHGIVPTKYDYVFRADKKERVDHGVHLEISYAILGYFGFTAILEDSSANNDARFLLHMEVPATEWFRFSATWYKWSFNRYIGIFDSEDGNGILRTAARIHPFPTFYINLIFDKVLEFSDKLPAQYQNAFDLRADIEFAWEWGAPEALPPPEESP